MSESDSILAAYLITALLVSGLCITSWIRARRVKRALSLQDTSGQ